MAQKANLSAWRGPATQYIAQQWTSEQLQKTKEKEKEEENKLKVA